MEYTLNMKAPEIQFALEVIQFSAELARLVRTEASIKSIIKPDHSPVTIADMGIQAIVGGLLEHYFPDAILVGEESADHLRSEAGAEDLEKITAYVHSFLPQARPQRVCQWIDRGKEKPAGTFWTIDPIDGTKGFLRGGQYATALALIENGKVKLAVLGCPELELEGYKNLGKGIGLLAGRGQGCFGFSLDDIEDSKRWVRFQVSSCSDPAQARMLDSFETRHKCSEKDQFLRKQLGIQMPSIMMDSLAKQAVLASGGAEIFFRTLSRKDPEHREKIWDVAAGALAVEEAGGCVTDLNGQELDFGAGITLARNPGLVATNGIFHKAVLAALQEAIPS